MNVPIASIKVPDSYVGPHLMQRASTAATSRAKPHVERTLPLKSVELMTKLKAHDAKVQATTLLFKNRSKSGSVCVRDLARPQTGHSVYNQGKARKVKDFLFDTKCD
jgi:hypothetical protein